MKTLQRQMIKIYCLSRNVNFSRHLQNNTINHSCEVNITKLGVRFTKELTSLTYISSFLREIHTMYI